MTAYAQSLVLGRLGRVAALWIPVVVVAYYLGGIVSSNVVYLVAIRPLNQPFSLFTMIGPGELATSLTGAIAMALIYGTLSGLFLAGLFRTRPQRAAITTATSPDFGDCPLRPADHPALRTPPPSIPSSSLRPPVPLCVLCG